MCNMPKKMVFKIIKVYEKYVNGLTYGESYIILCFVNKV